MEVKTKIYRALDAFDKWKKSKQLFVVGFIVVTLVFLVAAAGKGC